MMKKLAAIFAITAIVAAGTTARAAILAGWNFTGEAGNQASTAAGTEASNITASAVSRGSGLSVSAGADSISSNDWTLSGSIDSNDYYEFGLTVGSGHSMDLTTVTFAERRSATGIRTFELRSSLDSFGAPTIDPVNVPDDTDYRERSLSLPAGFTNLSGTVTFRLYGYSAEAVAGTWRILNNAADGMMTIKGSTSPTVVALIDFSANLQGNNVNITWETASEIDNAGFHLWRSDAEDGEYVQVTDELIPAEADVVTGASYEYTDSDCWGTCFYKLEDIDLGGVSTFHGPVMVEMPFGVCGSMPGAPGFTLLSLLLLPGAGIFFWRRRRGSGLTGSIAPFGTFGKGSRNVS